MAASRDGFASCDVEKWSHELDHELIPLPDELVPGPPTDRLLSDQVRLGASARPSAASIWNGASVTPSSPSVGRQYAA